MIDYFAVMGVERRPWLDAEALKARYHQLSTEQHPDVAGATADFAEINRAYQTLADPVTRLRHLIDLETPEALSRTQQVPEEIAPYFATVAETRQGVDVLLKKHAAAASPLARALLSTQQYAVQERVEEMIATLLEKHEELLARAREVDAGWPGSQAGVPAIWQALTYTGKWLAMLREALFRLASL